MKINIQKLFGINQENEIKIKKEYRTNVGKSIQLMIQLEKLLLEMSNHFGEELATQFVMKKTIELHSKNTSRLIKKGLEVKKLKTKIG